MNKFSITSIYFIFFVNQESEYQLKIYFCLLFSRRTDMANTNLLMMVLSGLHKLSIRGAGDESEWGVLS